MSVHPSVCPQRGYPTWPGGYPSQVQPGRTLLARWVDSLARSRWGVPHPGPHREVSPSSLGWGGRRCPPAGGSPHQGVPPWQRVPTPPSRGYPWYRTTDGVLDTLQLVCLLGSRIMIIWYTQDFLVHYFLPNPGRILPALSKKSKMKNCPQQSLNPGPLDHHSNTLLTELSYYLVVCVNHLGLYKVILY